MKRIIIVFLALFLVVPLFAQESDEVKNDKQNKGFAELDIGLAGGTNIGLKLPYLTLGYQFRQNFSLGLGSGYRYSDWPYIPAFVNLKANTLPKWNICYYTSLSGGYSFIAANQENNMTQRSGWYFLNPRVGINHRVSKKLSINLGLGYQMIMGEKRTDTRDNETTIIDPYHQVCFDIGLILSEGDYVKDTPENKIHYKCIVDIGYLRGNGSAFDNALKLSVINGYQINPFFSMGIGTGIWIHDPIGIPLFVDCRAYLLNRKIAPFIALDGGFAFYIEELFFIPSVGVSGRISKNLAINFSIGYCYSESLFPGMAY